MAKVDFSKLKGLGSKEYTLAEARDFGVSKVLGQFVLDAAANMREILIKKSKTGDAGTLAQSISASEVTILGKKYEVSISINQDYWQYVDKGVKGVKSSPASAASSKFKFKYIIGSSKRKGGTVRKSKLIEALNGQLGWFSRIGAETLPNEKAYFGRAFRVARAITTRGLEAKKFYSDTINKESINVLKGELEKAIGKSIKVQVKQWQSA